MATTNTETETITHKGETFAICDCCEYCGAPPNDETPDCPVCQGADLASLEEEARHAHERDHAWGTL